MQPSQYLADSACFGVILPRVGWKYQRLDKTSSTRLLLWTRVLACSHLSAL